MTVSTNRVSQVTRAMSNPCQHIASLVGAPTSVQNRHITAGTGLRRILRTHYTYMRDYSSLLSRYVAFRGRAVGTCESFKINNGSGLITYRACRIFANRWGITGIINNHRYIIIHMTGIPSIELQEEHLGGEDFEETWALCSALRRRFQRGRM